MKRKTIASLYSITHLMVISFFASTFLHSQSANAAAIGAKAVHVEGNVTVTHADNQKDRVSLGDKFVEGDTIITSSNGVVEIEYDTGDLTRMDRNTTLKIKSLHRNKAGSTFSVFGLVAGRIKSSVSKLFSSESVFEYHTKSAVAGVAGTPPFFVQVLMGKTNIDLTGRKGQAGKVYVMGSGPMKRKVFLFPGQRTIVRFGFAPRRPFAIGAKRLKNIQKNMRFKSRPEPEAKSQPNKKKKKKKAEAKTETTKKSKSKEKNIVVNNIASTISTFMQPSPTDSGNASALNMTTTSKQGSVGADEGPGVEADQPPPFATGKINLIFE